MAVQKVRGTRQGVQQQCNALARAHACSQKSNLCDRRLCNRCSQFVHCCSVAAAAAAVIILSVAVRATPQRTEEAAAVRRACIVKKVQGKCRSNAKPPPAAAYRRTAHTDSLLLHIRHRLLVPLSLGAARAVAIRKAH